MTITAPQFAFLFLTTYALLWLICNMIRIVFAINYIVTVKYDSGNFQKKFVVKAFSKTGAYVRAVKLFCIDNNGIDDIYGVDDINSVIVQMADNSI